MKFKVWKNEKYEEMEFSGGWKIFPVAGKYLVKKFFGILKIVSGTGKYFLRLENAPNSVFLGENFPVAEKYLSEVGRLEIFLENILGKYFLEGWKIFR